MKKILLVDYVCNPGGGINYTRELINNFKNNFDIHIISYGYALKKYRKDLKDLLKKSNFHSISPENKIKVYPRRFQNIPFTSKIMKYLFGYGSDWSYKIKKISIEGIIIFPWIHRHDLSNFINHKEKIFAVYHDNILFSHNIISMKNKEIEKKKIKSIIQSKIKLIFTSNNTINEFKKIFQLDNNFDPLLIPISFKRLEKPQIKKNNKEIYLPKKFIIYPANIYPHKNHEFLFKAFRNWKNRIPLILTGPGTELNLINIRSAKLRLIMLLYNLKKNVDIFGLGYLDDETYNYVLKKASGLIIVSKTEGGGSFPLIEAINNNIPTLSSNISPIVENIKYFKLKTLFFDIKNLNDLVEKLNILILENIKKPDQSIQIHLTNKKIKRIWLSILK